MKIEHYPYAREISCKKCGLTWFIMADNESDGEAAMQYNVREAEQHICCGYFIRTAYLVWSLLQNKKNNI